MHKILLPLLFVGVIGCDTETVDCPPDRACTMEFRSIGITLRDSLQQPYLLDSARTVIQANDSIIRPVEQSIDAGTYTVFTDSEMGLTSLDGDTFFFEGYHSGIRKVNEMYVIRHDCCHIEPVSGVQQVVVTD